MTTRVSDLVGFLPLQRTPSYKGDVLVKGLVAILMRDVGKMTFFKAFAAGLRVRYDLVANIYPLV